MQSREPGHAFRTDALPVEDGAIEDKSVSIVVRVRRAEFARIVDDRIAVVIDKGTSRLVVKSRTVDQAVGKVGRDRIQTLGRAGDSNRFITNLGQIDNKVTGQTVFPTGLNGDSSVIGSVLVAKRTNDSERNVL